MLPENNGLIQLFLVNPLRQQPGQPFKNAEDDTRKTVQSKSARPSQQLPTGHEQGWCCAGRQRAVSSHEFCKRRVSVLVILVHRRRPCLAHGQQLRQKHSLHVAACGRQGSSGAFDCSECICVRAAAEGDPGRVDDVDGNVCGRNVVG